MIDLKEKQNILDDEIQFESNKRAQRVRPSRASYYETYGLGAQTSAAVEETADDEYSIKLVKANKTIVPSVSKTAVYNDSYDTDELDYTTARLPDYKTYKNLTSELMPSSETMNALQRVQKESEDTEEVVNFKVNKKGALMLVIFAVVIIALFTMIIINAVSLVGLGNDTANLQTQVTAQEIIKENLQSDIADLENPDLTDSDFINGESSGTIEIETTMPIQPGFTGSTNLFDWILNNLFGWLQ